MEPNTDHHLWGEMDGVSHVNLYRPPTSYLEIVHVSRTAEGMKERVSTEGFHLHPGSSMPVSLSLSGRVSPALWVNGPAKSAPVFPLLTRH